jgi:CheY-like chemotaxis protein
MKRILIIEDNDAAREMYALALDRAGFAVAEAADGPAGIIRAAEFGPDLVLLDIGLPTMDGWEVCRVLNRDPATAGAKIVALTAHAFLADNTRSGGCVTAGFITKPAKPSRVIEEIIRLIGPP